MKVSVLHVTSQRGGERGMSLSSQSRIKVLKSLWHLERPEQGFSWVSEYKRSYQITRSSILSQKARRCQRVLPGPVSSSGRLLWRLGECHHPGDWLWPVAVWSLGECSHIFVVSSLPRPRSSGAWRYDRQLWSWSGSSHGRHISGTDSWDKLFSGFHTRLAWPAIGWMCCEGENRGHQTLGGDTGGTRDMGTSG